MPTVASDWTDWADATTWAGEYSPSAFTEWDEATTASSDRSPSPWSDWEEAATSTGGTDPSDWSSWVEATVPDRSLGGFRLDDGDWVALDIPRRRTPEGEWVLLDGVGHPSVAPPALIVPSAWSNWAVATTHADPPTWQKPLIGLIGTDEAAFQQMNNEMGPVLIRRTYNQALPSHVNQSAMASDILQNRISLYSWKPNAITFPGSSTARAALRSFLATIPAGHETYIMGIHEPEDNINAGDFTLAQWGDLQNAIATEVKSMGRPEIKTAFCLMGPWTFDTRSPYYGWDWPGAVDFDLIDMIGVDPYGKSPNSPESQYSLERLMTVRNSGSGGGSAPSMMQQLQVWGKPISLMEYGKLYEGPTVAPEALVAQWILESFDWFCEWNQQNPETPIHSALYYNMTITDDDTPLTTPVEKGAMAQVIANSKIPVA